MTINICKVLSIASVLLLHVANAAPAANAACLFPLHIIAARGSNQAPGTGSIGAVADQMKLYAPTAHVHAVQYPATMQNPAYMDSLKTGTLNLQQIIRNVVDRCPNAKIALLGYSQGANVVGDALVGSSENHNDVAPLDAKYADNIKAIVIAGDPAHDHRQQFTVGDGHHDGDTPRTKGFAMHPYSDRIVSYCDANDPVCDSPGGLDWSVHWGYMAKYKVDAAYFALSKLWE